MLYYARHYLSLVLVLFNWQGVDGPYLFVIHLVSCMNESCLLPVLDDPRYVYWVADVHYLSWLAFDRDKLNNLGLFYWIIFGVSPFWFGSITRTIWTA